MAVVHDRIVFGHMPQAISVVCSFIIRTGGVISSEVTGARQYSVDLPQVDLDVPCKLTFTVPKKRLTSCTKFCHSLTSKNQVSLLIMISATLILLLSHPQPSTLPVLQVYLYEQSKY